MASLDRTYSTWGAGTPRLLDVSEHASCAGVELEAAWAERDPVGFLKRIQSVTPSFYSAHKLYQCRALYDPTYACTTGKMCSCAKNLAEWWYYNLKANPAFKTKVCKNYWNHQCSSRIKCPHGHVGDLMSDGKTFFIFREKSISVTATPPKDMLIEKMGVLALTEKEDQPDAVMPDAPPREYRTPKSWQVDAAPA